MAILIFITVSILTILLTALNIRNSKISDNRVFVNSMKMQAELLSYQSAITEQLSSIIQYDDVAYMKKLIHDSLFNHYLGLSKRVTLANIPVSNSAKHFLYLREDNGSYSFVVLENTECDISDFGRII